MLVLIALTLSNMGASLRIASLRINDDLAGPFQTALALGDDPSYHEWVEKKLTEGEINVTDKTVWGYKDESHKGIYYKGECPGYGDKGDWDSALSKMQIPHEFAKRCHHTFYSGQWERQKDIFKLVMKTGIRPDQKFFDVGCGSMRLGLPMTQYLDKGNYYGLDADALSLRAAIQYEVPMAGLMEKEPKLLQNYDFEMGKIAEEKSIDLVMAYAVLKEKSYYEPFVKNAANVLKEGGFALVVGGAAGKSDFHQLTEQYGFEKVPLKKGMLEDMPALTLDLGSGSGSGEGSNPMPKVEMYQLVK